MTALHVFESNSVRRGVHKLCKRTYCVQYADQHTLSNRYNSGLRYLYVFSGQIPASVYAVG